jgi:hypothetical protein
MWRQPLERGPVAQCSTLTPHPHTLPLEKTSSTCSCQAGMRAAHACACTPTLQQLGLADVQQQQLLLTQRAVRHAVRCQGW